MRPQVGDVYFQDLGCGAVCNAIDGVTPGWNGAEINHCGIVVEHGNKFVVAEAINPKVRFTTIFDYFDRSRDEHGRPRILHSRLSKKYRGLAVSAANLAKHFIGTPYDPLYANNNAALYCSELIVDLFRLANGGTPIFEEKPMSFRDQETGEVLEYWTKYYESFGAEVPEGELGSNPGELSMSTKFHYHKQLGSLKKAPLKKKIFHKITRKFSYGAI